MIKIPDSQWTGSDGARHYVKMQGSWLKWRVLTPKSKAPRTEKRGEVLTFSKPARFRMFQAISRIRWEDVNPAVLITLTFPPREWDFSPRQLTYYKSTFVRYIEKHLCREQPALWRTEWKPHETGIHRGREYPHFHLICPHVQYIHHSTVNDLWKRTIGFDGYVRTEIKRAGTPEKCVKYCAKYCGKADFCSLVIAPYLRRTCGRQWGILRPKKMPWQRSNELRIIDSALTDYLRAIALHERPVVNAYGNQSFTLLGPLAEAIAEELMQGLLDGSIVDAENRVMR